MVALASVCVSSEVATSTAGCFKEASFSWVLGLLSQAPMDSGLVEREEEIADFFGGFELEIFGVMATKTVQGEAQFIGL